MRCKAVCLLFLCLCIAASVAGASAYKTEDESAARYGQTNIKGVNVRKHPNAKAKVVVKVPITGTVMKWLGEEEDEAGTLWIQVEYAGKQGFIRSDLLDEIGEEAYLEALEEEKKRLAAQRATAKVSGSKLSSHSPPKDETPAWVADGIYHSSPSCDRMPQGARQTTLSSAQAQGLAPCTWCWCLDCLFASE